MTMITPSYLGETIEYSSLHACRSTLEDPTPELSGDLDQYTTSKGTLQFPVDRPLPKALVKKLIARRRHQIGIGRHP